MAVGVLFLIFSEYKVFGTRFTLGGGFQYWIQRFLEGGAYPFMAPILKNFVLPHGRPIAFLVAYGELAIGIALMFGILVRPASICGVIYMLSLLFSANYPGSQGSILAVLRCFARAPRVGFLPGNIRHSQTAGHFVRTPIPATSASLEIAARGIAVGTGLPVDGKH